MTINLAEIKVEKAILPPRIIIYGPPKIGKTSFAASIPDLLLLDVEGGSGAVSVARIEKDKLTTFNDLMNVLSQIYTEKHPYTTLCLDSMDWIETLIFQQAAKEHGKNEIGEVGYGAGYVTAQNLWRQLLEGLDALRKDKGIMILMIAHEQIKTYNNPMTENYDRYGLKLRSNDKGSSSESIVKEWTDILAFVNRETFVRKEKDGLKEVKKAAGDRVFIYTQEKPAFLAGNRYGLPEQIPFSWEALRDELSKALNQTKETK